MKLKGLTLEVLDMATDVGSALEHAVEGLRATHDRVEKSQKLAKLQDKQSESLYKCDTTAIKSGDEETARSFLLERELIKEKLLKILKGISEDRTRIKMMEMNVEVLKTTRALEIDVLLRRSVGASSMQISSILFFLLDIEDPLLKKFRVINDKFRNFHFCACNFNIWELYVSK